MNENEIKIQYALMNRSSEHYYGYELDDIINLRVTIKAIPADEMQKRIDNGIDSCRLYDSFDAAKADAIPVVKVSTMSNYFKTEFSTITEFVSIPGRGLFFAGTVLASDYPESFHVGKTVYRPIYGVIYEAQS